MKLIQILSIISLALAVTMSYAQPCVGTPGEITWSFWRSIPDDEIGEMWADEYYPYRPDGEIIINSTQSPTNYDNRFGSLMKGYISVPATSTVTFNITGDDNVNFYLSTDESPDNLIREAYIYGFTGTEEHDKYESQTTREITLQAGSHYYFELHHVEGGGGDHSTIYWRAPFVDPDAWWVISTTYLHAAGCLPERCPDRGTPCDDDDPTTSDDQEDGHCHCVGIPATDNACIGERGKIETYYYDHIPGGDLNDLLDHPNFPAMPDRSDRMDMLASYTASDVDSFGTLVQGYLTVPEDGYYEFNITSDNEAIFFLSANEDPALKQTHQIFVNSSTGATEHDRWVFQSTAPLQMEAGTYYFFEINHKEGSWREHFSIFWKTPYKVDQHWKRIPGTYLYDYDCEISCVSEGTPCDDGDPFTNDDQYDADCNCVGTPCSGEDCDNPIASYQPYDQCGLTDILDNRADLSWQSCTASLSPNPARGSAHWLQYDLGQTHNVNSSHVWNYNVANAVQEGFQQVAIDYSLDGQIWTELGQYNWSLASGQADYSGFVGPSFDNTLLRYILVTSLDGTSGCRGISKMTFTAQRCEAEGTPCDDGDPDTSDDQYDANCNCVGDAVAINDCLVDTLQLRQSRLDLSMYSAIKLIESNSMIEAGGDVTLMASDGVALLPGFEAEAAGLLTVQIGDCTQQQSLKEEDLKSLKSKMADQALQVAYDPESRIYTIGYYVEKPGWIQLLVKDPLGKRVVALVDHEVKSAGYYTKRMKAKKLDKAVYEVSLSTARTLNQSSLSQHSRG